MQVLTFLLETVFFFLVGAALLRAWMNQMQLQMSAQPGRFALALTDWLVQPVRRVLPRSMAQSKVDWGSLVSAALLAQGSAGLSLLLNGTAEIMQVNPLPLFLLLAVRMLLRVLLQGLMFLLLAYAVLSWAQPHSPLLATLDRLCAPLLRPLRRWIPLVGGVDLSVLVLLIALQIGLIVLG